MNFDSIDYKLFNCITRSSSSSYYDDLVNVYNYRKKLDKYNNFTSRYDDVGYYNCKLKKYNDGTVKVKKYDFFRYKGNLNVQKNKSKNYSMINESRKFFVKQISSLKRSRANLFDYVENNKNKFDYFVTLTFDSKIVPDDINSNIVECNKLFHNFVTMYRKKYGFFTYIVVPEYQKRGAVHYHLLAKVFENSLVKKVISKKGEETLAIDCWNYGISKCIPLSDLNNVAKYIAKYMVKDNDQRLYGFRFFHRSQDVVKPVESFELLTDEQLYDMGCDLACPDFRYLFEVDGTVLLSNSFTCFVILPHNLS